MWSQTMVEPNSVSVADNRNLGFSSFCFVWNRQATYSFLIALDQSTAVEQKLNNNNQNWRQPSYALGVVFAHAGVLYVF